MKSELRTQRELLIFNLYKQDIFKAIEQTFIPELNDEELLTRFEVINDHLSDIDDVIESQLFNYTLNRLSYVDRAIIRNATFELMYTKVPTQVIMNEAIEITKEFTNLDDEKQHKFTNKLLDNISQAVRD